MMASSAAQRLEAVGRALESVADATVSADAERLTACEQPLCDALADMPSIDELTEVDRDQVQVQLRRIERALSRCRTVGAATTELVAISLAAQGMTPGYLPAGVVAAAPRMGRLERRG